MQVSDFIPVSSKKIQFNSNNNINRQQKATIENIVLFSLIPTFMHGVESDQT